MQGMLHLVGVNTQRFIRRWGLEPFTAECGSCGSALTTSIPFYCGQMRGLVTPRCSCGAEFTPYCIAWSTLPRGPMKRVKRSRRKAPVVPLRPR